MPSSFFHHTPSVTMDKLNGSDDQPHPTSPRQPHANHFSGKTLRSLFTTKRSDNATRSASVATSSIFSGAGTIRSGPAEAKGTTNGRMRDKVMNMGTSRRRSDLSGTTGERQGPTAAATNATPAGSRLMQGTVASRSRAAQSMPPPPTTSHPVGAQGTVRFPGRHIQPEERVVSPASTVDSDLKLPATPVPVNTRKKKNSLSLFLSSSKARASLSSTGTAPAVQKENAKTRVTSNPVAGPPHPEKMKADVKRSQTTVKKAAVGHATSPDGSEDVALAQETRSRREKRVAAEIVSPTVTSSRISSTTISRIQSPTLPPRGSSMPGGPVTACGQEGSHFVLRLAVTYLTKTVLPELRSSRRESNTKSISGNTSHHYRKDLLEKLRPLERMERSWGIDWMLKGREGFKVSSRTREKERDTFRQAIGDGSLLLFLTDRTTTDDYRSNKQRLEAVAATCRSFPLTLDEGVSLEAVDLMEGEHVYTAAALVVALARFAGPGAKQAGSGDDDDDVLSRSPSPVLRVVGLPSEAGRDHKHRPEPVAIAKVHDEPVRRSSSDSHRRQSSQPKQMTIRLPSNPGKYHASNAMHSKLDTVLSVTPGEGGYTPMLASADALGGYFDRQTTEKRSTSPSRPILKSSLPASDSDVSSASLDESSVPFRFHSRDPTPSLISGTTARTSMALSDPPERGPRTISFASQDGETKRQIKKAFQDREDTSQASGNRQNPSEDAVPMTPVTTSAVRFRPRVQRGMTVASSISSIDAVDRPPSRRNSENRRPQYIPRRHTTQAPPSGFLPRQGEPHSGRLPIVSRVVSGSQGQPYSPPATPRRTMSPSFSDSPYMPSSRRTSFTSATSQSPAGRDSLKPLVIVKDVEGRSQTYQLGNCIGKGQFGIVYRALNLANGQFVAVKRIVLENLDEDIDQIMREVEVLKRLKHPSIVRYLGMTRDERYLDIILEYVEGGSLANASRSFGKFSEHLVACYAAKMLEGLHYLHSQDVVHCDLKAANILITKRADVRLTDFGVSLNLRAVENQKDDNIVGTPNWVAPEIISLQGASKASDIWSLGCTIVELLEGKPPWAELDSNMAVLFKIVEEEWPIPPYYSPELKGFLGLCFRKNPSERPTAETLFDHEWIRNEIGIDPRLRNHDSIPFLRRISGDAVRLHQLRFDAGAPGLFSHLRDPSSPSDADFSHWKVDRHRPGLSEYSYSSPTRPDLRSNPGSSFSVRSDDTDPGQARPAELIEAERQRAFSKLTSGPPRSASSNFSSATPVLPVHYPTRAKERLERLRESDGRRGSAETDTTTKPNRTSSTRDLDVALLEQLSAKQSRSPSPYEGLTRAATVTSRKTAVISQGDESTIRPSASAARPTTTLSSPPSARPSGPTVSRYNTDNSLDDNANTKGDCSIQ